MDQSGFGRGCILSVDNLASKGIDGDSGRPNPKINGQFPSMVGHRSGSSRPKPYGSFRFRSGRSQHQTRARCRLFDLYRLQSCPLFGLNRSNLPANASANRNSAYRDAVSHAERRHRMSACHHRYVGRKLSRYSGNFAREPLGHTGFLCPDRLGRHHPPRFRRKTGLSFGYSASRSHTNPELGCLLWLASA